MRRVVSIVYNAVSHDARVLKEARVLASSGWDVTILGVTSAEHPERREEIAPGLSIERMPLGAVQAALPLLGRATALVLLAWAAWTALSPALASRWPLASAVPGALAMAAGSLALPLLSRNLAAAVLAAEGFGVLVLGALVLSPARAAEVIADVRGPYAALVLLAAAGVTAARFAARMVRGYRGLEPAPPGRGHRRPARRRWDPSELRALGRRLLATALQVVATVRELRRLSPDVVHCHDLPTLPAGVVHRFLSGARLVYDSHEIFEEQSGFQWTPLLQGYLRLLQRWCSRHVDAFVTINESIAEFLRSTYPALPPAVIIKNATPWRGGFPADDGRLRARAGLDGRARVLLYQGGFSPMRGLEALVRAASHLPESWYLVLMGWGALESRLRAIADGLGPVRDRVRFLPRAPQSELAFWTAGADLGVIPYPDTGLNHQFCTPNKLWEYPAAGVPLLVTPLVELERTVRKYGIGWVLPSASPAPEDFGGLLRELGDGDLASARGACARFLAEDNWEIYAGALRRLYRDLGGTGLSDEGQRA